MADNDEQTKFDLDARDALGQLNEMRVQILSIGDAKNLDGLVKGLVRLAGPIAAVGVAALAVKASFDLALEGSKIENMRNQFDALAQSVGVNSDQMAEDIQTAIGKTVDFEDALQASKKAMSLLGDNSKRIPEMFEVAKKAAAAFGGETTERFEQISNAIATMNTKRLKDIGITVNAEKAMRDYAKSINTTVGALSEQGKQAAIAEAVLKKANERFANTKAELEGLEGAQKRFSSAWKNAGDGVAEAFNKMFGPVFSKALEYFSGLLDKVSTNLKANFGEGLEKVSAQAQQSRDMIEALNKQIEFAKAHGYAYSGHEKSLEAYNQQLKNQLALEAALKEEQNRKGSNDKADKAIEGSKEQAGVDSEKELQQKTKFENELLKIKEQRLKSEMEIETNAGIYADQQLEMRVLTTAKYDAQIAQIKAEAATGETITAQQSADLIEQIEQEKAAKISQMIRDEEQERIKAYDNQVKSAKTAGDGMSAAFAQGAAKAQLSLKDYGAQGQVAFNSLNKNAAAAFKAFGDGSKSAGDAMKGFLLGSIADVAESQGQFLLASGIGTMNPVQIAQGGALIALAGLLRSQAGSAGGDGGGSSSSGGGGGGAATGSTSLSSSSPELSEQKKKSVTFQVMGNYFETEQTQKRIMEMIRQETDATDFKYQQIGGS